MVINLLNLFFPKLCLACSDILTDNEVEICTCCRHELPLVDFKDLDENSMTSIFAGRVEIDKATSLLWFQKRSKVQRLLHNLKYRGMEQIGRVLGSWLGAKMCTSADFETVDMVIPVPLHRARLRQRGYNQVSEFGKTIAEYLNCPFEDDILKKASRTSSQVFKKRKARWQGHSSGFHLDNPNAISGKHILLVDDLVTTGATLEACINVLQSETKTKISLATMAIAD